MSIYTFESIKHLEIIYSIYSQNWKIMFSYVLYLPLTSKQPPPKCGNYTGKNAIYANIGNMDVRAGSNKRLKLLPRRRVEGLVDRSWVSGSC